MTLDLTAVRSRRAMLGGTLAGLAALAADVLPRPIAAQAANGDVVHVGDDLTGTGFTKITTTGDTALVGKSTHIAGIGLFGDALNEGVHGRASAATSQGATGVRGLVIGVKGAGVRGDATAGSGATFGVVGESLSNSGVGVLGRADGVTLSAATTGVRGEADSGVGVFAKTTTGVALKAEGKVQFSRSARTLMTKGHKTKKINLAGVTSQSLVFAVLGSNRSGRHVRAVVPVSGSFTVHLNTTLTSDAWLSWFVLN